MFNTYSNNVKQTTNTNINAVTGAILKNHPMSWFERFHLKSKRAEDLLTEGGHKAFDKKWHSGSFHTDGYYTDEENPDKDIVVLQMIICGEMEVIAECVYAKDYIIEAEKLNKTSLLSK